MSSSSPSPSQTAQRYFLAGLFGLPAVLFGSVVSNFDVVYGRRLRSLRRRPPPGSSSAPPSPPRSLRASGWVGGGGEAGGEDAEEKDVELERWVDRSAALLLLYVAAFGAWIVAFNVTWRDLSEAWLVRTVSPTESSGW